MAAKFEFNNKGIQALLKSAEVQADLTRRAEAIAAAARDGEAEYEVTSYIGPDRTGGRAMAKVRTANFAAMRAESEDRNLTRALDAGRG